MNRLLIGAAVLAVGVVGADVSFISYISGSAEAVAFAQSSPDSAGFGNGGAALGLGTQPANGSATASDSSSGAGGSGATQATGSPDEAVKVDAKPGDSKAADDSADTEVAPEESAATATATAAATTTTTSGDPEAIGTPKVDLPKAGGNGNLGYSVAIDVPSFHGIEPQIALNYNSSRKTKLGGLYQGWLGYAWGLDGFDVIERATPGYGMPAYDANDIYLLDGQAMVACVAGMVSPSCSTGGTHATENESYRRIALTSSTNEWKVTDRDGTVSTFRSVGAIAGLNPAAGTPAYDLAFSYRWLLTSVTDTNGNTVTYSYTCPASPVCYPASVTYNGASITFSYETRPDPILMGNGRDISVTDKRIKTIGITVSGAVRGAYTLTYDQAPFSNASRLTKVTRYGTDATIAADGTITGGTPKVVGQMAYQNADWNYTTVNTPLYEHTAANGSLSYANPKEPIDLDFDGRDELCCKYTETTTTFVNGGGGSSGNNEDYTIRKSQNYKRIIKFGSNGAPYDVKTLIANSTSTTTGSNGTDLTPASTNGVEVLGPGRFLATKNAMDFAQFQHSKTASCHSTRDNGEVCSYTYSATPSLVLTDANLAMTAASCSPAPAGYESLCSSLPSYSNRTSPLPMPSFAADTNGDGIDTPEKSSSSSGTSVMGVGDFLGNGKQQPLFIVSTTLKKGVLSSGTWQAGGTAFSINCQFDPLSNPGSCVFADLNGDGATDVARYRSSADEITVYLSTGVGFKSFTATSGILGGKAILGDFDNDGKTDVFTLSDNVVVGPGETRLIKVYSLQPTSSTAYAAVNLPRPASIPTVGDVIGDFNGDGLADFTTYTSMLISNAGTGNPNLVKQIVTELGATVAVEYTPSSTWANNYLPQVVHAVTKLSVSDGRGQTAVSSYQYSGGKYDPAARKFLGFASIVETKPLTNGETAPSTVTTSYRQDLASYGLPSLTVWKDGAGTVHKQVAETYAVNTATKPYWVQNTATDTTLTENIALTTRVVRYFDAYNNITTQDDYGRTDTSGDELRTARWFIPNTSAYIVSLPC
ncbi:toxin TcdB middle/N-terminal domain-containing protein, partial [Mesorhizobium sp.]|uniref:toxin TcdB middle/N-terminal domain-containing protein n=1 Tax=Mesorhizobium sp. TaxID=1871066 RepID=UPI0011FE4E6C